MPPLDVHSCTYYLAVEKKNEHFMLECFLMCPVEQLSRSSHRGVDICARSWIARKRLCPSFQRLD